MEWQNVVLRRQGWLIVCSVYLIIVVVVDIKKPARKG